MLAPPFQDASGADKFGGNMTRRELKMIKSTPKHAVRGDQDGIADSLSTAATVIRAARKRLDPQPELRRRIDPILGVAIDSSTVTIR